MKKKDDKWDEALEFILAELGGYNQARNRVSKLLENYRKSTPPKLSSKK